MENIFYEENFCRDLDDLLDILDLSEEDIKRLPEDYSLECYSSVLEPIVILTPEKICEYVIDDERWPDDDRTYQKG